MKDANDLFYPVDLKFCYDAESISLSCDGQLGF